MNEWNVGDAVLGRDGWITVTSIEFHNQPVPVYNLEVHGEHVYEVTEAQILVHNSGDCLVTQIGLPDGSTYNVAQVSDF